MNRQSKLKFHLFNSGRTQREISLEIKIPEGRLSSIIHGRLQPTEQEIQVLSDFLKIPVNEIFD